MESWFTFLAAALALTASPGPNTLSLAAVGAAFGYRRGVGYMLGLDIGMLAVIAMVGSGITGVLVLVPGAAPVITALAAGYFAYLAWRIATAPPLAGGDDSHRPPSWIAALFVSLANPKAYAAMAAMFSGFVLVGGDGFADTVLKGVALVIVIVVVNVVWLLVGSALTPHLREPGTSRIINITFAVALVLSVALALLL